MINATLVISVIANIWIKSTSLLRSVTPDALSLLLNFVSAILEFDWSLYGVIMLCLSSYNTAPLLHKNLKLKISRKISIDPFAYT